MTQTRALHLLRLLPIAAACALVGCANNRPAATDEPTLASLSTRQPKLTADPGIKPTPEDVITAYRQFIDVAVDVPQRAESLRRLGDLEMDSADRKSAAAPFASATGNDAATPDYKAARARYEDFLKTYPKAPKTDRVLYQLARAQDQAGEMEAALATLTQLVTDWPGTLHVGEAQFRRGEMLFARRDYAQAEAAYDAVLRFERRGQPAEDLNVVATPLTERALYMRGWSLFKLGRQDEALAAFFEVLDAKLAGLPPIPREETPLAEIRQLTRADRELLADTLRVLAISLANLQGPVTLARYVDGLGASSDAVSRLRRSYQFRVHEELADLYLKQERVKDAADALSAFVRQQPLHPRSPALLTRAVQIYAERGFAQQALAKRREFVTRYGSGEEGLAFQRAQPTVWRQAQTQVQSELGELARFHHAQSQQTKNAKDADEAARWYRALLQQFPQASDSGQTRFLLGELLFETRRYTDAAAEYEAVAYGNVDETPQRRADAGYAALLSYAELEKQAAGDKRQALQQQAVASALRFAEAQTADARTAVVLVRAAEQLQALGDGLQASAVAQRALAAKPADEQRRAAWVVVAQQASGSGEAAEAEAAYAEVLALTPKQPARAEVVDQLAASIYRQGEQAREAGELRDAVGHFERAAAQKELPPASPIRTSAAFDAATALVELKDWPAAAAALEAFRRQHPKHELQATVAPKLALVYEAQGKPGAAALEFERVAAQPGQDAEVVRSAQWRVAELRSADAQLEGGKNGVQASNLRAVAVKAWERYLQTYPQPLEPAVEARWQLLQLAQAESASGPTFGTRWRANAQVAVLLKQVQQADAAAGEARTPRTRTLGGRAALALAEPVAQAYRAVPLVEPLATQLKLKKAKFESALKAYSEAAAVGITEVTTAATFQSAALYQDFGRALLNAPRPKKLNKAELEQYGVMLEEQAYPFEEQAIALFETNARRTAAGTWDAAVRDSLAELAQLKPARWGKAERGELLPLDRAAAALQADPKNARALNQHGLALRREGRFDEARLAYEAAIAQDPKAADATMNLAILHDLYLGDAARATALYQRCLELSPADAPVLNKWLAELKSRKPVAAATPATPSAAVATRKEPS